MTIQNNPGNGIVLLCDNNGMIQKVLTNKLALEPNPQPGLPFVSLLSPENRTQGLQFILETRTQQAIFGRQLEVNIAGLRQAMQFAGGLTDAGIIIIGALSARDFEHFYLEITKINNEQANLLRQLMRTHEQDKRSEDAHVYEDFTRLNNELSTLQRELAKKNIQLETLNEQKNQLLGMAAHDLRNPLGVIMSYAKFLQHMVKDKLVENELKMVEQIERSSEFMLRLLEDLLDISQIESGKLTLNREATDLDALIDQNIELNRSLASAKGIKIILIHRQPTGSLSLDKAKLEQVLNNLVSNAIKYSHKGTQIEVVVDRTDGGSIAVHVRDQGQGIPASEIDHLFKAFSKTSVRSTAGEKSTGLGLVITKCIIEGHGGHIWVDSIEGEGSTFSFSLPCEQ